MERYESCNTCNGTNYLPVNKTWSDKGTLNRSDWSPFEQKEWLPDNNKETYYTTLKSEWTKRGNITPHNSDAFKNIIDVDKNTFKESFCNKSTYPRVGQTWNIQKAYTSN